jgi:pyruvate/2-oxoglutarate dehydrogenase complex dihydrolipoamide dehydrogenase (E3) component
MKTYDAIFIGSGQALGAVLPTLLKEGQTVALAEGGSLGGTCLNYGCRPTKTLRASARIAHLAGRAGEYGVKTGSVEVDFQAVMARKNGIIGKWQDGITGWLENTEGLDLYREYARFVGRDGDEFIVQAGDTQLIAPSVYMNTGTRAFVPPIPGINTVPYLTNVEILDLNEFPKHLIVLGGGYIGLEFAQMFRRFGSEVTLIEGGPHVASREDEDVSIAIEEVLTAEGIALHTNHLAQEAGNEDGQITIRIEDQNDKSIKTVNGSHLLVAIGRRPNTENLNLESVGLKTDERGFLRTDGKLQTAVPGIWALGDMNGKGAFTHTSYQDGEVVQSNHVGGDRDIDDRVAAYALFIDPPMARVGLNEKEAVASGKKILKATWNMEDIGRGVEDGETTGFIKLLVDAGTERFVGAMVFGMQADDIIQVISNFMATGSRYKVMKDALPIHPTVAEFLPTILAALKPVS